MCFLKIQLKIRRSYIQVFSLSILFTLFLLSIIHPKLKAQDNESYAKIFIYFPDAGKKAVLQTIYFNEKKIETLGSKEKLVFNMYSEGSLTITSIIGSAYVKPSPTAANTRTVTVAKGKSYYFELDYKGAIEYLISPKTGEENFADPKKLLSEVKSLFEDPNNPIPSLSIEKEIVRQRKVFEKTKEEIIAKEKEIQKQIDDYFADLKKDAQLAEGVHPSVSVRIEEDTPIRGRMRYNLRAVYSYEVAEQGVKAELAHYPSGKYQLPTSAAAKATTQAMKTTIEKYLTDYFEPGSTVHIWITGSADAMPIVSKLYYEGEYGALEAEEVYLSNNYQSTQVGVVIDSTLEAQAENQESQSTEKSQNLVNKLPKILVSLQKGNLIKTNEQLAFLRTFGIRDFVGGQIKPFAHTRNLFEHRAKVEGLGSHFRKVIIELQVKDVLRNR
ncbi:MAG: hypothetical protein NW226_22795 [Microscillaceae bacterium]|nr:hypothetical protein [Microscillaceae bacterium]